METWLVLFLSISWGGPIGLGILLMGLGVFYWGKAQEKKAK
jgi:hypothetical protein